MVVSRRVPKAIGDKTSVHAVRIDVPGPALYVAQILPLEAPKGAMCTGPIRKQADVVFAHLRQIVIEAGFRLDEVVRVTLQVTSLKNMAIIEELWGKLFFTLAQPARTVLVVAGLPSEALIALDAVAVKAGAPAAEAPLQDAMGMQDEEMY